ncbi:MAG TPA: hypothetical protein VJ912_02165 [Candidatus Nanoarchaeia archaeon]|nr:hypothetical protein [Candidatus Nanoarchaeia archaeon]
MEYSKKTPGLKGLDIDYDFCNEKIINVTGNVEKSKRAEFVNKCWEINMDREETYDIPKYQKKQIYSIMLRTLNGCVIAESNAQSRSLTNDMLEDIIDNKELTKKLENM